MEKYKVCVVGCGNIASLHLRCISECDRTEIIAVCDIREERAKAAAEKYSCRYYTDYTEMYEKEKPYSVHICLPHYLHESVACYFLERGVRVLSEKPMNANLAGATRMKEYSEKYNTPLGVIFQNRYNSGTVFAKSIIESGKLGTIKSVVGQVIWHRDQAYYDQDEWRTTFAHSGGGVCVNQAIHTLDLIRYLASNGGDATLIHATASHHGDTTAEVEDTAEGLIQFDNGVRALFYFTINDAIDNQVTVKINGTNGTMSIIGGRCFAEYSDGTQECDDGKNSVDVTAAKPVYGSSHSIQIEEFYSENSDDKIRFTLEQAYKTQQLLDAIYKNVR